MKRHMAIIIMVVDGDRGGSNNGVGGEWYR
jgi:hypothetical protein